MSDEVDLPLVTGKDVESMNSMQDRLLNKWSKFYSCYQHIINKGNEYYINYCKHMLSRSGDIESNPGPYISKKKLAINMINVIITIILILIIINKMKIAVEGKQTSILATITSQGMNMVSNELVRQWKRTNHKISHKSSAAYLILLILLSNDVGVNPGPVQTCSCSVCGTNSNQTPEVFCEDCNLPYHLKCIIKGNENIETLDQSFEWVCRQQSCKPNHYIGKMQQPHISPNKYDILLKSPNPKARKTNQKRMKTKPSNSAKTKSNERKLSDRNLLSELPKISCKDYVGKELCNSCLTTIASNSRAVKCKSCDRWTHEKCCDINKQEYKKLKNCKNSKWNCKKCRFSETTTNTYFSKKLCTENQLPDEWDDIVKNKRKEEEIIIHFNCRSIIDKADEVIDIANKIKPAIIFLTETWLDESCPLGTAVPENYTIIRKDRSSEFKQKYGKTNGGGVAILVRKGVKLNIVNSFKNEENEILWCNLKMKKTKHLIALIYRASYTDLLNPDVEGSTELEDLIQQTLDTNLIMIGDLNCDTLNTESTPESKRLMNITEEYELKQLIDKPTRFCESTATTIDHIWVRDEKLIRKAGTCEGISDHCGIYGYIREVDCTTESENIRRRSFKSFNIEEYRNDIKLLIQESNFRQAMEQKDVNLAFNSWIEALQKAANKHAPWKTFKPKQDQKKIPWFCPELEDLTKTKNMYLKLYRMYNRAEDKDLYRIAKNKQTHLARKSKREYYTKKINDYVGESKKMWSILKEVTNQNYKEDIRPDIVNISTANRFNDFFAKVGITVQNKLNINISPPKPNKEGIFKFKDETTEKIEKLINRIKPNVATGHDELSARLIKAALPVILEDLKDLVNLSYKTKIFPDHLKKATVKALHKKGGNNDPSQYRPVSILTIISKIFERSAVDQLVDHYNKHKLLNAKQHAYRKFHSTTTCLFELVETARKHIDNGNLVAIASLDLSKAFDSLAHNLILKKLNEMGLNETATSWVQSYLTNRKQTVRIGNIESGEQIVESGVPQGSILGPLLFITCTNDIAEALEEYDIFCYADDMQIVIQGKSVPLLGKELESAIRKANNYYNKNSLQCNPTKTEVMLLGTKIRLSKADQLTVKTTNGIETKLLTGEKSLKILGVHIDDSLDWNKHTSLVKQRATNSIRNLHRINQLIPMKQRRILYNSLVTPHFSYADTIWGNCGAANCKKIQLAQNFAAKSMLGLSKFSSSTQALKKLELMPLSEKRKINTAVQVKKSLSGKAPENLQKLYQNQMIRSDTRAAARGDLNYPKHRLQQYQQGPLYASIKHWNAIPENLRDLNLTCFKRDLQKYMTTKYIEM